MKDWKTTLAGVLTGVAGIATAVVMYLNTGQLDFASIGTAIISILAAFGLVKAADSK